MNEYINELTQNKIIKCLNNILQNHKRKHKI